MKTRNFFKFLALLTGLSIVAILFVSHNKFSKEKNISAKDYEEKESSGALDYLQYISQVRAYPNKDIPPEKFYKGFEHMKTMPQLDEGDSPTQWTSIGPNNEGGRSLCLAVSPADTATLFIGSASGGLWKSTTGGLGASAWTYVETGYPSLAVSYIAIDSANPNTMYIGTGECYGYEYSYNGIDIRVTRGTYGIGILKSTDGGNTWSQSLNWAYNSERGVWRVLINPKNHNTLYAATTEGVYKSLDAGNSWNQMVNYKMCMDLLINPQDTTMLFVSVGDLSIDVPNANVGLYKSTNSGATWTKMTSALPTFWSGKTTLALYNGTPITLFASVGNDPNQSSSYLGLYTSTDLGNTWSLKYNNTGFLTNQGWYNNAILVKPGDPNSVMLGNLDVYRSTNGGSAFTHLSDWTQWNSGATPPGQPESNASNYSHADQHFFTVNPKDPNKFYSLSDGGLYRSNDFGTTFYSCNGGYVSTQFFNGFANSYQDSIFCIGGMQDNRSAFYQGTTAWYKTFEGDGYWCAVNSTNATTCYTEYSYGDINRSGNGGVSWTDIAPPGYGSCAFSAPYICCRSNPNIMYFGGSGNVYRSANGGSSWAGPYGNFNGAHAISMDGSATFTDTVYCGTVPVSGGSNATIWRTVDGTTWTDVGNGTLPNAYPTDIHVNPNNSKNVFAVFGGFGNPHVMVTTNAGGSWTNITNNLPDVPYHSVVIDPLYTQNVYVGCDLGVYASTNGGASWAQYNSGMPTALVFSLKIVYPNRHIRAATHGHGIYERNLQQFPLAVHTISSNVPKQFNLYQNYPNPFNPSTKIKIDIPSSGASNVKMVIYDILGREITTVLNKQMQPGTYEVDFDATRFTSGVYFYKLTAGSYTDTKKIMLLK